jgi:hypothetical protein
MVNIINSFKIFSVFIVTLIFISVLIIIDITVWQPQALPDLTIQTGSYIKYGFNLLSQVFSIGFIYLASSLIGLFNSVLSETMMDLSSNYYNFIWLSQAETPLPDYNMMLMNLYYFSFQLLIVISAVSIGMFILKLKSKFAIISFISLQAMIVLAALFNNTTIGLSSIAGDPAAFFTNPVLVHVLLSYLFLEITFTSSHVNDIFGESLSKERIIIKRINTLRESESRNILEGKNFDKSIEDYKLNVYLEELNKMDPNLLTSLSAKSTLPSIGEIFKSFLINLVIRIAILIFLVYIIINPVPLLTLLNAPPSIIESLEILTPEIVVLLLIPISLLFPFASLIISYLKKKEKKTKID